MATPLAISPSPDRPPTAKEIPPPLSLTVDSPAASSPFPSPSSSFVPPPMPGAHEFAHTSRFKKRNKVGEADDENHVTDIVVPNVASHIASVEEETPRATTMNGCSDRTAMKGALNTAAVKTDVDTTMGGELETPTAVSSKPDSDLDLNSIRSPEPEEPSSALISGRDTPTQAPVPSHSHSPPQSQRPISTASPLSPSSKHTSLSSSRPAPASPSPAPSRRPSQSRRQSRLSTTSGSTSKRASTSLPTQIPSPTQSQAPPLPHPTPTPTLTPPMPSHRPGQIRIRDFAYASADARHTGTGPDTPKIVKKLLKKYGPRSQGESESQSGVAQAAVHPVPAGVGLRVVLRVGLARAVAVALEDVLEREQPVLAEQQQQHDERREQPAGLGHGRHAAVWRGGGGRVWRVVGGRVGFGRGSGGGLGRNGTAGKEGGGGGGGGDGGYTPSRQELEHNFVTGADGDEAGGDSPLDGSEPENAPAGAEGDEGDEEGGEFEGEQEHDFDAPLHPGVYKALYDFTPEGTAEMGLKEGQLVRVVGRGGGVGWAVVERGEDGEADGDGENEGQFDASRPDASWALVPESYLRLVRLDDGGEGDEEGEEGGDE
ncbi:hypothetical protein BU17DRAFT_89357 [Hysterangium stoloniferum]|nr:hypothetical protein BU17DRAFT_89357 [Hysterangium stoloniferum]